MEVPKSIEIRLSLPGFPELQPLVADFAHHAAVLADIAEPRRGAVRDALLSGVALVEGTLATAGDEGVDLELTARIHPDRLEFSLLESGIPLGGPLPDAMGRDIGARIRPAEVFDRVWWVQRGRLGSELHLAIDRDGTAIHVLEEVRHRHDAEAAEPHEDVHPSEESTRYSLRPFQPNDALEVARQIYESYGRSYPNPDLYVPDRIRRLNEDGRLQLIVCEAPDGTICGHYALERPDLGPIGEAGQAVLSPDHRGHGLMRPMRSAVEDRGRELGLIGIFSQPTAMHPLSQKMNIHFGAVPCALMAGILPAATDLRGGVAGEATEHRAGGRRSCFLYWHPFGDEPALEAHVPEALIPLLADLYEARGRDVRFNASRSRPETPADDAPHTVFAPALGSAWIAVHRVHAGSADAIQAAASALESGAEAGAVFIDLPIDDPETPAAAERLLASGFRFGGVAPRSIPRPGDLRAEDALRLHRHAMPVDLPGLVAEGELGRRLLATAFPEGADVAP